MRRNTRPVRFDSSIIECGIAAQPRLQPEILLPSQRDAGSDPRSAGELRLLAAILHEAVQSYRQGSSRGRTDERSFRDVEGGIFARETGLLTSFGELCRLFDIDPVRLRRTLRNHARLHDSTRAR
jgi:hypothetical protein